ncbi:zinc finger MYM-type protein 1-like [Amphibalanus amphitrite]|uniref:zinc finger MYM-type protein 1-like n=1 Tax=Amphibalanus amphitrite TaxID=1232801 RepID=UPI001C92B693|nr:zinc finger MYM-type protein 1-like [Amphibalanus amphitrite]XP_043193724.1 zinc finger MYM-type protein 1-like [Amphibalanus amphitrite]
MSKWKEPAFVNDGFNSWKKAQMSFAKHEKSMCHQEACMKELNEKQEGISALLSQQASMEQAKRRTCLKKVIETLLYLLRQNISIRGKDEADGNLCQLLSLRKKDVPELQHWKEYLSPTIQNELIRAIGTTLLRDLLKDIREARFFAILADETTDVSLKEQVSLSIRWVDADLQVHEDPVELIHTEETTGEVLTAILKDALVRMELPLSQCRGQAYDGAANMQGKLKGVATRISQECPAALHVHCLAHCTNLVLQEAVRKNKMIRNALDITNELTSFVRNSPKTAALLRRLALGTESGTGSLRPLCPTRWTCRTASLRSVLENYELIMHTLEEVSTESSGEHARRAGGMLALMGQFDTLMGLRMAIEVFSIAEDLSRGLQSATATVGDTQKAVTRVCERFDSMRTTVSFDKMYEKTERDAEEVGVDGPQLPRKRKVPMKLGGGDQHPDATAKEMYRRQFFEVLDLLTNQLKERFTQPTFEKAREVERVLEVRGETSPFPPSSESSMATIWTWHGWKCS